MALYYYSIGIEYFLDGTREEIEDLLSGNIDGVTLTETDRIQVWEVYVYFMGKTKRYWGGGSLIPRDVNGNTILLNEWDNELEKYNRRSITLAWNELTGMTEKPEIDEGLEKFSKLYDSYIRGTGKLYYLVLPRRESVENVPEVNIEETNHLGSTLLKDYGEKYTENVVLYELGSVISKFKEDGELLFTQHMDDWEEYDKYDVDNKQNTLLKWVMKGIIMSTDVQYT